MSPWGPSGAAATRPRSDVPPFSPRYAIPPEHGKRLERLAIGRCLRWRGGPGGEARAREAGRLGGAAAVLPGPRGARFRVPVSGSCDVPQGVAVLFPRPLACSHGSGLVPLPRAVTAWALHSVLLLSPQARASVS